jgi:hypothetical protein
MPDAIARMLAMYRRDPIRRGTEVGFSSAGSGAIGTLALLNLTRLTPARVVGTDVVFGLVLSLLGGTFRLVSGGYGHGVLTQLIIGGVFGALIGPNIWLMSLGSLMCWRAV